MKPNPNKTVNENQWFVNIIIICLVFIPPFITIFFVLGFFLYLEKLKQTKLLENNSFFLIIYSWLDIVFSITLVIISCLVYGFTFEPTYVFAISYLIISFVLLTHSMKHRKNYKNKTKVWDYGYRNKK